MREYREHWGELPGYFHGHQYTGVAELNRFAEDGYNVIAIRIMEPQNGITRFVAVLERDRPETTGDETP